MDREIMREIYLRFYGEKTQEIISQDKRYPQIRAKIKDKEAELEHLLGNEKAAGWNIYDNLLSGYWDMLDLAAEIMYLRGAEDRDRILR